MMMVLRMMWVMIVHNTNINAIDVLYVEKKFGDIEDHLMSKQFE